jgi:hypothetical protein
MASTSPVSKPAGGLLSRLLWAGVYHGLPPAALGYRYMPRETVPEYFARHKGNPAAGTYETIHPQAIARHPLPCNVSSRETLPDDRGWWGYSFRDVPARASGETFIATLPNCRITWYRDPAKNDDFVPAILSGDKRALDLREVRFRPPHAQVLRRAGRPARLKKATWFIERVYHNHSHWLTAHLPKLLLLRDRGQLGDVLLPPKRSAAIDGSLRLAGLDPASFRTFDMDRPLEVEELTILGTDRFRPELLQLLPQAYGVFDAPPPTRRVYISRAKATRRVLVNEEAVWSLLEPAGFERVFMEDLTFTEQVQLMKETAILFAPHGAGLTNMLFCPPGCHVVEMADLSFPNPNFYAVASAMGHRYWLLPAEGLGEVHPLEKDLRADVAAIKAILPRLIGDEPCQ